MPRACPRSTATEVWESPARTRSGRRAVQPRPRTAGWLPTLLLVALAGRVPAKAPLQQVYLGPSYTNAEIRELLQAASMTVEDFSHDQNGLLEAAARRLAQSKVIGWFQGRMEFGPRSLGARSILADPRVPDMRDRINAMVKKREAFRPFAPAVLEEKAYLHFELQHSSPFMLETCKVISAQGLPAITHVDGSARVQTVNEANSPRFAALLKKFDELTGCPILLNTSFNVKDEPIVCTPADALMCFIRADIDCLVIEDFIIDRSANDLTAMKSALNQVFRTQRKALNHNVYTFI